MDDVGNSGARAPTAPARGRAGGGAFGGVLACFVLSGFAALLYQTAWLREFSVVFGTSELAVAAVLAAYMAGLALGAAAAARLVRRVRRPVLVYGLLELGIALGALAVPLGLSAARAVYVGAAGGRPDLPDAGGAAQLAFCLLTTFALIVVPTALMGATLPLLSRHVVRREEEIGPRVGLLYAMNTAGAVAGTLVAGFVLLPALGLRGTVWCGVAVNGLVFLLAAAIARGAPTLEPSADAARAEGEASGGAADGDAWRGTGWVLPLMLLSGVVSFTYEVLWTRLLAHLVGGSVYAFATMLASFLTGITLGSAVAARLARTRARARLGLALAQVGTAALSLGVYLTLDGLAGVVRGWREEGYVAIGGNAAIAAAVLLPATLCIGATFPFALRVLARDERDAAPAAARVYAWNTLGGIAGAVLAGFWVLPALGFHGTLRAAVAANLLLALGVCALVRPVARGAALATLGAAALAVLLVRPSPPEALMRTAPLPVQPWDGEVVFSAVGRSAAVIALERDGYYYIRSNGLPEADVVPRGAPPMGRDHASRLALLPVLARPAAREMLVVGFGGGVTLEDVPPSVRAIDVVELEPEVVAANRAIADRRRRDPLRDERLRIVLNDARGALALTEKRWDVVVSQPSHPWTAGASHLYTREFVRLVHEHLAPDGVFVQWMNVSLVDEELVRVLGATLLDVFAHGRLYRPTPWMLVFLASDAPLEVEAELARTGQPVTSAPGYYARQGVHDVNDVLAWLTLDEAGLRDLCRGAPVSTDDENLLAMRAMRALGKLASKESLDALFLERDPVLDPQNPLAQSLGAAFDPVHLAERTEEVGLTGRTVRLVDALSAGDPAGGSYALGTALAVQGRPDDAARFYKAALEADPGDERARYMALRLTLPLRLGGEAVGGAAELRGGLTGPAAAAADAWTELGARDWAAMERREADLAAARPIHPWFPDALALRGAWRAGRALASGDAAAGAEALELVDRALVARVDPLLCLLRLDAARAARDDAALVETAAELALFLRRMETEPLRGLRGLLRGRLVEARAALAALALAGRAAERRDEVLALLDTAL